MIELRILALVPARGGSKRVPGKNIRLLGGRPLIKWSIDALNGIADICDVLVSTDDAAIAEVARAAGAIVPWLRPNELATDTAKSVDVCLHALDWYEREKGEVDGVLLMQPTSPFRSRDTIVRGINLFREHNRRSVLGVAPTQTHPMWCFEIQGESMRPYIISVESNLRSQDLPPAYVISGVLYLLTPRELRECRTFYNDSTVPLIVDRPEEGIDIDTEWDWAIAEAYLLSNHVKLI